MTCCWNVSFYTVMAWNEHNSCIVQLAPLNHRWWWCSTTIRNTLLRPGQMTKCYRTYKYAIKCFISYFFQSCCGISSIHHCFEYLHTRNVCLLLNSNGVEVVVLRKDNAWHRHKVNSYLKFRLSSSLSNSLALLIWLK